MYVELVAKGQLVFKSEESHKFRHAVTAWLHDVPQLVVETRRSLLNAAMTPADGLLVLCYMSQDLWRTSPESGAVLFNTAVLEFIRKQYVLEQHIPLATTLLYIAKHYHRPVLRLDEDYLHDANQVISDFNFDVSKHTIAELRHAVDAVLLLVLQWCEELTVPVVLGHDIVSIELDTGEIHRRFKREHAEYLINIL